MPSRLSIVGQDAPETSSGSVVWQTAFRPFFLGAAGFGVVVMAVWMSILEGWLAWSTPLAPFPWHGHEMIFGFALAVVAGFVLTATQVWTGLPTVSGTSLFAIFVLWVGARVGALFAAAAPLIPATLNVAVPLLVAIAIGRPIVRARSWRNAPFILLLLVMAGASAFVWTDALRWTANATSRALWVALDVVSLMIVIVGGRIVPMFTRNATGAKIRPQGALDLLGPSSLALLAVGHAIFHPTSTVVGGIAIVAGALNVARMVGWGGALALRTPFVGVLHAGYGFVAVGLLLEGGGLAVGIEAVHLGRHVLAVGGVALMSLGMMTRVSLGHTGRPLQPPRSTHLLYGTLLVATVARFAASLFPGAAFTLWWVAAVAFATGFLGFIVTYASVLVSPRADGKPG